MYAFCIFLQKNLHMSQKSSTFAPAFTSEVTYDDFIAPRFV
jgi:hypothetical protein